MHKAAYSTVGNLLHVLNVEFVGTNVGLHRSIESQVSLQWIYILQSPFHKYIIQNVHLSTDVLGHSYDTCD
jgi:hypothetical protein